MLQQDNSKVQRGDRRANEVIEALQKNGHVLTGYLLDLGCGQGHIAATLATKTKCNVISIDISLELINDARKNAPMCEFIQCDGAYTPFRDGVFRTVASTDVLEHTPYENGAKIIKEAARVATDNGMIYLSAMNRWEIMEPHWLIPFFTWTPRFMWNRLFPVAVKISPIAKAAEISTETLRNLRYTSDIFPYTRGMMRSLLNGFKSWDMTSMYAEKKISDPDYIGSNSTRTIAKMLKSMGLTRLALAIATRLSVLVFVYKKESK